MDKLKKENGQAIIAAALIIAIGIILVTVFLNSLIFSGNLASQEGENTDNIIEFRNITVDEAQTSMAYTAESNYGKTPSEAETEFKNYMKVYGKTSQIVSGSENTLLTVEVLDAQSAWMIRQNVTEEFTDASNNSDWDVTEGDVSKTHRFDIETRSSDVTGRFTVTVLTSPLDDNCDIINGTLNSSSGCVWRMNVTSSAVEIVTQSQSKTISYSGNITIDIVNEEVSGSSEELFSEEFTSISGYRVRFTGGDKIQGNYDLRIDSNATPSGLGPCTPSPSGYCSIPTGHITGTVENAKLFVEYVKQNTEFNETITVESGG